ncbi:MAG TPA: glycosyltransferase [Candidatus Bathyarchaeia archaeon]|nr:glycosyltransferase [Candidatus Bathyarchaeia archaeon]
MLIGVNAVNLRAGWGGGEERYLRAVLGTMRSLQPHTSFVIFTGPACHESFQPFDRVLVEPTRSILGSKTAEFARQAKPAGIDLLLTPLADAPAPCPIPTVLLTMGLHGRRTPKQTKNIERAILGAAMTVAPSEFVRKQLAGLGAPLDRVVVAPYGIDPAFGEPQPGIVEEPYLLAVGDTRPFKSIDRLQHLFHHIEGQLPHLLVVAGRPCEAEPGDWGPRVIRFDYCPASYLAALYQHCDAFVHPNHDDGVAVTVLEAMRCSTPVVAWRAAAVPEYAGDIPVYPNADTVTAWAAAVRQAMDKTDPHREKRLKVGRQLAAEHTWEKTAWKLLTAFKHAKPPVK